MEWLIPSGQGRSREACQEAGAAAVYMDYLRQVCYLFGRPSQSLAASISSYANLMLLMGRCVRHAVVMGVP
jgi:hypothetical protein